ncbi:hypothetical protein ACWF94_14610 [Streptomyces sp. NPDC055078]
MRDVIARVLLWALERVLPAEEKSVGRHRHAPPPAAPVEWWADPWTEPWTTPTPAHVIERHAPLRGEDSRLVRPYALLDDTLRLRTVRRRPRNLVYAVGGIDHPFTWWAGAPR